MHALARVVCLALLLAGAVPAPAGSAATGLPSSLAAGAVGSGEPLLSREALRLFYAARGDRPAWSDGGIPSPQVDALVAALRAAGDEGLRPADYHLEAIAALLGRLRGPQRAGADAGAVDDLDLLSSDAFFLYAAHLTVGRVAPATIEPAWNIPGRARDLVRLLSAALEGGHLAATLRELPPPREDYRRLREALSALRAAEAAGGWPIVPWGPALREGDRAPRVAALRRRLAVTGDLPAAGDTIGEVFDAPLAAAVRRFRNDTASSPTRSPASAPSPS